MGRKIIALGHGRSKTGAWDAGAVGNGTSEAEWLRGPFLKSLKKHAAGKDVEFYEQNMFANRDAAKLSNVDEVIELHLDAAGSSAKGGHVIIYKNYKPDALDKRLGGIIQNHFGLRGGIMFDYRNNLYNLNTFARRGISYRLLELGFITNKQNMDHFKKHYDTIAREIVEAVTGKKSEVKPVSDKKSDATIAREVIAGKWGNGQERARRLNAAGYNSVRIQNQVNVILNGRTRTTAKTVNEVAREVIAGKWGNGEDRKKRLTNEGYDAAAVQKEVNRLI